MSRVVSCRAEQGYRLWVRFEDGVEGHVYLGNLLEISAFRLWRDMDEFFKVSVDTDAATATWAGGIRLDPEVLYQDIVGRRGEEVAGVAETGATV
jgi:hypothetical protein